MRYVIWCQVIDHFGDAGVCWRLARALAQELAPDPDLEIILAIDRPAVLGRLVPAFESANHGPTDADPIVDGVRIVDWRFPAREVDVMISTFGCRLPHGVLETMGQQHPPPVWINLEHLSPQTWVNTCHTLPSPNPINGLPEVFFFPGFDPQTGGLLREANLLEHRDRFHADPQARDACLAELGVGQADRQLPALLAFGYADAPLDALIQTLAQGEPMLLLLPSGPAPTVRHGVLRVHAFGWVPQSDFDRLLWCCSAAFVRGEDSLVRAHSSGNPTVNVTSPTMTNSMPGWRAGGRSCPNPRPRRRRRSLLPGTAVTATIWRRPGPSGWNACPNCALALPPGPVDSPPAHL